VLHADDARNRFNDPLSLLIREASVEHNAAEPALLGRKRAEQAVQRSAINRNRPAVMTLDYDLAPLVTVAAEMDDVRLMVEQILLQIIEAGVIFPDDFEIVALPRQSELRPDVVILALSTVSSIP
jgi:hypothetical protein